ncbi:MAG TPA: DUF427 domain-containing protein [Aeromicrobium sp.]|jgi:uncharacterized protein (DUF427 family)|nr:DUF427 domain-containing protein [Aeromicrobium sp.]HKY57867.1 DUF427 domain-containing protein [Aeromicrobium sp.]
MTMQAVYKGTVIAESDDIVVVEGNHYFPLESLRTEFLEPSTTHTTCGWKGVASYYDVNVDGAVAKDAVWYYPTPSAAAREIKDRVAFWRGVEVQPSSAETAGSAPTFVEAPNGATC